MCKQFNLDFCFTSHFRQGKLISPSIYPDELLHGYIGRLGQLNGHKNIESVYENIRRIYSKNLIEYSNFSIIDLVSSVTNLSSEYLLINHTLFRKMCDIGTKDKHRNIPSSKLITLYSSFMKKEEVCFCKSCVKEDIDYIGFSYWRRSHQMHCLEYCLKHEKKLCSTSKKFLFIMPHQVVKLNEYKFNKVYSDASDLLIRNYINICEQLMYQDLKLDFEKLLLHLKDKAALLNLRTSPNGKRNLLSDLILESFPHHWLFKHFKYFKKKRKRCC